MTSVWDQQPLLADLRHWAHGVLAQSGIGGHEVRILLEWALKTPLLTAPAHASAHQAEMFRTAVLQRARHMPLQHILGRMWFRSLELESRPGVFIVRPETEVVAGLAIEAARVAPAPALVVDLCTGSGAIALSMAAEVPGSRVVGVDLSEDAISLARRNAKRLESDGTVPPRTVRFLKADATASSTLECLDGRADVVVSNPPYVPGAQPITQEEAQMDPSAALYGGGEDGMVIPRGVITRAFGLLRPGGTLVMEHDPTQGAATVAAATDVGFAHAHTHPDLTGRPRVLVARKAVLPCDNKTVNQSITVNAREGINTQDLRVVRNAVSSGQLLVLPTDTVYGIGADASNPDAVNAVLAAKGRGRQMPPPVLVGHPQDLDRIASDVPEAARRLAEHYWPGGLTLIVWAREDLGWDVGQTGGTIALRMPDHPVALAILNETGPLAVTSANLTGQPPATTCAQAVDYFQQAVSVYVDGGPTPGPTPSTIIDCAHGALKATRVGTLALDALAHTAGVPIAAPAQ